MPIEGLQEENAQAGEAANVVLHAAVGIEQLGPANRDLRMFVHEPHQRLEGILDQQGVAIQQAGIASPRQADTLVHAPGIRLVGSCS